MVTETKQGMAQADLLGEKISAKKLIIVGISIKGLNASFGINASSLSIAVFAIHWHMHLLPAQR